MSEFLFFTNAICVLLYGLALSFAFAGLAPRTSPRVYGGSALMLLVVQAGAYLALGALAVEKLYPLLVHLPIFFVLHFWAKRGWLTSLVFVMLAYLLCTPRLWVGNVIAVFFGSSQAVSHMVQCLVTLPLLWVVLRFFAPYVRALAQQGTKVLWLLVSLPLGYYLFDFSLTVYSDWYYTAGPLLLGFMDASIVLVYVVCLGLSLKILQEKQMLQAYYQAAALMNKQAEAELAALRAVQEKDAVYRHDLRHHLAYIRAATLAQNPAETLQYIEQITQQLDETVVKRYCANENVNLILSAYLAQAKQAQIATEVAVESAEFAGFASIDLCSLLANALENAVQANAQIEDASARFLRLRIFCKGQHLCIELRNACRTPPMLRGGIPVTNRQMHGFGVKSMVGIVEKYGGTYTFELHGDTFVFQALLPQPTAKDPCVAVKKRINLP